MAYKPNFHYVPPKKPMTTELGIQQMVANFSRDNELALSAENKKILSDGIEREHDGVWNVENLCAVLKQHRTKLTRAVTIKTLPRTVTPEEALTMVQQVMAANPWIANTEKNGELIAATFLGDPHISPKRNLQDMIKAVEIVKNQLDRTPPPPPPAPPQYEESVKEGMLPYPQADWQLRRASREQVADYVARLRKREGWEAQQKEIGQ